MERRRSPWTFTRAGHAAWAFLALFFASGVTVALAFTEPTLADCARGGTGVDSCSDVLASTASIATLLVGLSLLFAVHAIAAFRMKRGLPVLSLTAPRGWTRRALMPTLGLLGLAVGAELTAAGFLAPWAAVSLCHEACALPYVFPGTPLALTVLGLVLVPLGACLFARTAPRRGRFEA